MEKFTTQLKKKTPKELLAIGFKRNLFNQKSYNNFEHCPIYYVFNFVVRTSSFLCYFYFLLKVKKS